MNRRHFLAASMVTAASVPRAFAQSRANTTRPATPITRPSADVPSDVAWHDVRDWGVEGRAFDDTEHYFDRLPARAKRVVRPPVWNLSRDSSGMVVHFEADTTALYARYALVKPKLEMPHMPATGVSGLDLYGRSDANDRWLWLSITRPASQQITTPFVSRIAPGRRAYRVELPLYNGVTSLEIGVPKDAPFTPVAPRREKPICFYGTSITHGACASRPGMSFVNLLGRRLDRPVLNFGFSGNGKMELEVARFLAETDPAVYVLDCVANTDAKELAERTAPLVKLLREARPTTPILLLEGRLWANSALVPHLGVDYRDRHAALRGAYDALRVGGMKDLHYRSGEDLIGADGEGTTDGSHPNDLGMMRYADALEPTLRKILNAPVLGS